MIFAIALALATPTPAKFTEAQMTAGVAAYTTGRCYDHLSVTARVHAEVFLDGPNVDPLYLQAYRKGIYDSVKSPWTRAECLRALNKAKVTVRPD